MLGVSLGIVIPLCGLAIFMFFKDFYDFVKEPKFDKFKDICFSAVVFLFCCVYLSVTCLLADTGAM